MTEGVRAVMEAMAAQSGDPFQGVVSRHVMPDDMVSQDMEAAAATAALDHAGLAPRDIDVVLAHTAVPEYLMSNPACALHDRLGIPPACLTVQVDGHGYSFLAQLSIAAGLIESGRARRALLVQSCAFSRVLDPNEMHSTLLGDGASAVVVGPVDTGNGILAAVHHTDGRHPRALMATVPGKRWYDDGRIQLLRADPVAAREVFLSTADSGKLVVGEALAAANLTFADVDFFAAHQGTPWLRRVAQDVIGLARAKSVDVFARTGYLSSVSIPLVLAIGHETGALSRGDLAVLFGGGVGSSFGATIVRWGAA